MSLLRSIRAQLGLMSGGNESQNHFFDGSVPNQLTLKRGVPDAPGATVMQVVSGNPGFPGLSNYADDAAAATGGVPVGGLYRTASAVKVRVA